MMQRTSLCLISVSHRLIVKEHRSWGRISARAGNLGEKEDPTRDWLVPEGLCSTA